MFKSLEVVSKHVTKIYFSQQTNINAKKKLFSGIQPTGMAHLGNYLGAIQNWVFLQNANENLTISIVDLHAMTLPNNRINLNKNILEMAAILLACGLDPNKTILFQQSMLPQHAELCWHLSCMCTMVRLSHLPQYKEKSSNLKHVPVAIFLYPILQAADILIHKATHVPVGADQIQHLHLTQHFSKVLNDRFNLNLPMPQTLVLNQMSARIKSLRDPLKKMSKSDCDSKSRIDLIDNEETIHKKIQKAITDFTPEVFYDSVNRPGISNLIEILSILSNKTIEELNSEVRKLNTVEFKSMVASTINAHLEPIRTKYFDLIADPQYLLDVLNMGAERAFLKAEDTINEIREKIGLNFTQVTKKK